MIRGEVPVGHVTSTTPPLLEHATLTTDISSCGTDHDSMSFRISLLIPFLAFVLSPQQDGSLWKMVGRSRSNDGDAVVVLLIVAVVVVVVVARPCPLSLTGHHANTVYVGVHLPGEKRRSHRRHKRKDGAEDGADSDPDDDSEDESRPNFVTARSHSNSVARPVGKLSINRVCGLYTDSVAERSNSNSVARPVGKVTFTPMYLLYRLTEVPRCVLKVSRVKGLLGFDEFTIKTTLSTPDRDSNPYLPNIGQPVLHEDDALSRLATEAVTPPAQRVQFILGEDANDGTHTSHPLFSEMEELVHKGNNMEWKETAR
uniref:Uncharacterized protein n=1 Tax=Timema tahoe TaxID=61484 RepID=A0A7R9I8V4_9NEOP|nr:unnamed protein product [Timema tahoe]